MTAERWQRVKEIFQNAVEIGDSADRMTFVRRECAGDESLLKEVQELLACHDVPGAPIEKAAEQGIEGLRREMAGLPGGSVGGTGLSSNAEPPVSQEGSRVGSIRLDALLGIGGMGEVYRGFDEKLERTVAVKTVKAGSRLSAEAKARFLREARILSKLNHPGICQAYDLIETQEADYLVLEYVEGTTLAERLSAGISGEEKFDLSLAIADALAAAHDTGVVHRDLKPDNIMVTKGGVVKVLDFGIARSVAPGPRTLPATATRHGGEQEAPETEAGPAPSERAATAAHCVTAWTPEPDGLTRAGTVVGTPLHMSPEQIKGGSVTQASDMFSYGLLLQQIFTGKPAYPVDLTWTEIVDLVSAGHTRPVEGIDFDLARLIRSLTAVDFTLRPTAREATQQIRAVREKPQRIRRKRVRMAVTVAVTAVVAAAGLSVLGSRLQARRQVEIARRFAEDAKDVEWLLRVERMMPVHDMRPVKEQVRLRMNVLEASMREIGRTAAGPGNAALGRASLALLQYKEARAHLEEAWKAGYQTPDVAYALGHALGGLYRTALADLNQFSKAEREKRQAEIRREYRDPALRYLHAAAAGSLAPPDYVRALLAFYEERYDEALRMTKQAYSRVPWLLEARVLEGEVSTLLANKRRATGDYDGARAEYRKAADAFDQAIAIGRSDERAYVGLFNVWHDQAYMETILEGGSGQETRGRMLDASELALRLNPDNDYVLQRIANSWCTHAERLLSQGMDPSGAIEASLAAASKAILASPKSSGAYSEMSLGLWERAKWKMSKGIDPRPDFEESAASARKAIAIDPKYIPARAALGLVLMEQASYEVSLGENPTKASEEALGEFKAALEIDPTSFGTMLNSAIIYAILLEWEVEKDAGEPERHTEEALGLLARAQQLNPRFYMTYRSIGETYALRARMLQRRREDPGSDIAAARSSIEKGLQLNPDDSYSYKILADTYVVEARHRFAAGLPCGDSLGQARAACRKGLAITPGDRVIEGLLSRVDKLERELRTTKK